MSEPDANAIVTASQDGRTLSGVGVSEDALLTTMDRHTPDPVPESAPAATGDPAVVVSPSTPKPTRGQARFSELTQKAKDAEAKAEAAEKKAADLEARLAQQLPATSPTAQAQPESAARREPAAPSYTRPKPTEDEIGTKYLTYADFTEDIGLWVLEQQQPSIQAAIRQGIDADRQQQAFTSHVERTRAKGRAAYADYDQMLASGPGTHIDMPMPAIRAIFDHPQSEHIQYRIMKDGQLAQRLAHVAMQSPYQFGLELAALAPAPISPSATQTTIAPPAPVQPVGSGSRTTVLGSAEHAKAGNYEAYRAARAAERNVGRRR